MDTPTEKLLEAASLPDNFDAFLRRVMEALRSADAFGDRAAIALVIAPGENTPGSVLSENFSAEDKKKLLELGRSCGKCPEKFVFADIDGGGTGGCLLAEPSGDPSREKAKRLLLAAAKAISGRLERESRERVLTRERDTADAVTHLEELFLSLPEMTIEEASRAVLDEARRLTGSGSGFAGYISPETGWLRVPASTGEAWEKAPRIDNELVFKEYHGLWGWVLKNRKPLLLNSAGSDPRAGGVPSGHLSINRFAAAPAISGTELLGILTLANPPADYPASTMGSITRLARVYALILRHKFAELQKRAVDDKYRSILDSSRDLIFNLTAQGKISYVSRAVDSFGYSAGEVMGRHFHDFVHPGDRKRLAKALAAAVRTGSSKPIYTYRLLRKDGTFSLVEQKSSVLQRPGDMPLVTGVIRDITSHRRTEERLAESELKYKAVFDKANAAIIITDPAAGKILDANRDAEKLTGRGRRELIGLDRLNLHPPAKKAHYRRQFREHVLKGLATLEEAEILRKDGTQAQVQISTSKLTLGGKAVMLEIFQDVTAQRKAERLLQDIVQQNPLAIQIVDKAGYTLSVNLAHTRLFGSVPPPEYSIFKDPQLKKRGFGKFFARVKKGQAVNLPAISYNAHDTDPKAPDNQVWLKTVIFPLSGGAGKPERFVIMHEDITRRKLAEERFRDAVTFNKDILDNAQDGIIVLDTDMRTRAFSPAMEHIFGVKAREALGRRPLEFFPFLEKAGIGKRLGKILRGEKVPTLDFQFYNKKTGKEGWASANSHALRDSAGRISGIVGIIRDITAGKKTEEKYRALVESTDTGYLILNSKGQVVDVNNEYLRLTGRRNVKEILGRRVTEWTAPYDRERNRREVEKCLKTGSVRNLCIDYTDKRGRITPIEINATVVKTGDTFQIVSLCRDISGRKQAEERLRESEEKHRRLVENLGRNYFFYRHDAKGVFNYVSRTITGMLGYSREEFLKHFSSYLTPNPSNKEVIRRTMGSLRGIQQPPYEVEIFHKDGSIRHLEVTETPIFGPSGEITGVEGLARDITEQKRTAEHVRESEARYHTLFDMAADGIFIMSADGKTMIVNNSFARMHGYAGPEEMAHIRLQDLDTPETSKLAPGRLRRIMALAGKPLRFEVEHYRKDGHVFPLSVSCNVVKIGGKPHFLGFHRDITENRRAEAELKENAALLKAQQEASPDGILVVDEDGKIRSYNKRFWEIWKLPAKALASGSDKRALKAVLRQVRDPREFLKRVEHLYKHPAEESRDEIALKDGRVLERFSTAVAGEDGRYYGRTWHFRDITERRRAADLLAESEKKFRTLVEASFNMIYLIGRDDTIQYMNPAAILHLGRKFSEVIGKPRARFFPPQASAQQKRSLDRVFSSGEPLSSELGINTGKKEIFLETNLVPIKDAGGEVVQVLGISRDVTERRRLQNVLMESEETLRTVFETARDAIFIKDLQGRYTKLNKACADVFGMDQAKAAGKTDRELFPPEVAEEVIRDDHEVARTGRTITRTYDRVLPSGKYYFNTIKTPLRDPAGRITGILGIARDITEVKKMEAELALSRAIEAVSREARPMAHDFNNVLTAINGYATMIDDELKDSDPIKDEIGQIINAVKRASELTSRFQTFARNPQLPRHPHGADDKKRK